MKNGIVARIMFVVSMMALLGGTVGAFTPPLLRTTMGLGGISNWTGTNTTNVANVAVANLALPVFAPVANVTNTTIVPVALAPQPSIRKTLSDNNGQTFGWIASTDPTGLGIRSNMDMLCTMYVSLGGVEVYFQTNSFVC